MDQSPVPAVDQGYTPLGGRAPAPVDDAEELRRELRIRMQELSALELEVRHLRADMQVKDEYIAQLRDESPDYYAEVRSARRYLAFRRRLLEALGHRPLLLRIARAVVRRARRSL